MRQTLCLHMNRLLTSTLTALGVANEPTILMLRNEGCRGNSRHLVCSLLCSGLKLFCLALGLFVMGVAFTWTTGIGPVRIPVELFWWPQPASLGGAGFPPPEPLPVAMLLNSCPNGRPRWPLPSPPSSSSHAAALDDVENNRASSVRRSPR
jgi:hypothetical protein